MRWTEAQLTKHQARRSPPSTPAEIAKATRARARARRRDSVMPQPSENQIHEAVVEHLRIRGRRDVPWFHVPNGELRDPGTAAKLQRMGVLAGVPDLLLLIAGRLHGLELKRERGGRESIEQQAVHAELRSAGAVVETAYGLDQALEVLESWGALLPASNGRTQ